MGKVLLRSERQMMFFGGYLGIGLVMAAQTAADGSVRGSGHALPNSEWLALPLILAFFVVTGLRFAFDMPAALEANWIFRAATGNPLVRPDTMVRRFMLGAVIPWEVLAVGAVTAGQFGWTVAVEHVATLVIVSVLLIDAVLIGFRKIPFTCSMQFDTRQLLIWILACVLGVLIVVPMLADFELWMLNQPERFGVLGISSAGAWHAFRRQKRGMVAAEETIPFEEQSSATLQLLKLT